MPPSIRLAQISAPDGHTLKQEIRFADAKSLYYYVAEFMTHNISDLLRVYLPSDASNEERAALVNLGAIVL